MWKSIAFENCEESDDEMGSMWLCIIVDQHNIFQQARSLKLDRFPEVENGIKISLLIYTALLSPNDVTQAKLILQYD